MIIVIDARALSWTGIGRYARGLLDHLQVIDRENQYMVLVAPSDWSKWEPKRSNFLRIKTAIKPYSLGEQIRLAALLHRLKPDLVHFLSFNAPVLYRGAHVTTIHDLTLVDYKNRRGGIRTLLYGLKYWAMRYILKRIIHTSKAIITPAEYTKRELVKRGYAPSSKITAIHHGAPELPRGAKKHERKDQTLLYVGNLYPYKNLERLVMALPALTVARPGLKLIIVGKEDVFGASLKKLAAKLGVADSLSLTGFVSDNELANHYRNATLYVFPSLSEGFGLPPLEAMSYGLPVAAAKASCLPEVLGEAAVYFDPNDTDNIARVISDVLDSPRRLAELRQAGLVHVKLFSWERMAQQTREVYMKALSK